MATLRDEVVTGIRLVEGDPMLHAIAHSFEDNTSITCEVLNPFFLIKKTTVALVELLGSVPVVESDEGGDAGRYQVVDELDVVLQTSFIDRVITTSFWDDTSPYDMSNVVQDYQWRL